MVFGWFKRKEDRPRKNEAGLFKQAAPGGEIAHFGLSEWWLHEFSEAERDLIRNKYQPMGTGDHAIDRGALTHTTQDAASFASIVAGWFTTEDTRHIAYKFMAKSEEYERTDLNVLTRHFGLQARCMVFYRWRDLDDFALEKAIDACERSIEISAEAASEFKRSWDLVPSHHCFKQLAIIEEKRGNYERAINLCKQAASDGWKGDWEKRIERLRRKASR